MDLEGFFPLQGILGMVKENPFIRQPNPFWQMGKGAVYTVFSTITITYHILQ